MDREEQLWVEKKRTGSETNKSTIRSQFKASRGIGFV